MAIVHAQSIFRVPNASGTSVTAAAFPAVGTNHSIFGVVTYTGDLLTSVTDNAGNTYSKSTSVQFSNFGVYSSAYWLASVPGNPTTLTCNFSSSTNFGKVAFDEYSGGLSVNVNGTGQYVAGPTTNPSISITPTVNGCLVWGYMNSSQNGIVSGSGFELRNNDVADGLYSEDLIQATAGAISVGWIQPSADGLVFAAALAPDTTLVSATPPVWLLTY